MPVIDYRNVLKGLTVQEAMRRQVIQLPPAAPLAQAIRYTIKYKVNALLVTDEKSGALGVVSKTDIMGAYYTGLPLETPCGAVMVGPPLFCRMADSLDQALESMRTHRVHRLYVGGEVPSQAAGVLAYPDIVGILYRYCNKCERSIGLRSAVETRPADQFRIREVMTPEIYSHLETDSLQTVMAGLAAYRLGAVLIKDGQGFPAGVISKTDLIIAYKHGIRAGVQARTIMNAPVVACAADDLLVTGLQTMIMADVHRLFVYKGSPQNLVGVLSLSDVARFRSGTCRACLISRIKI